MAKRHAVINSKSCVACGCCVKVCPKKAIHIFKGLYAKVNDKECVGCGKCSVECPASIIIMEVLQSEN